MKLAWLCPILLLSCTLWGCSTQFNRSTFFAQTAGQDLSAPADIVPIDTFVQFNLEVPLAPSILPSTNQKFLVYELIMTNMIPLDHTLSKLDIIDADSQQLIKSIEGVALRRILRLGSQPQIDSTISDPVQIGKGETAIAFLFLDFPANATLPRNLSHRLFLNNGKGLTILNSEDIVSVDQDAPVVLSPPVSGGPWFCDGALADDSYHRRTLLSVGGKSRISQRYAIDFELLTPAGRTFSGDETVNENYPCYGQPILAGQAGTVALVVKGLPDNTPPNVPPFTSVDAVGGNGVILDIGNGKYIVHGHMQSESITLSKGDTVTAGQQLGLIGNSGNSSEPHLHIQVCDRPSFLGAQGLPYVFDNYNLVNGTSLTPRSNELPLLDQIIEFSPPQVALLSSRLVRPQQSLPKCDWH